ncbi:MAG: iron-containing alcohol dehydrogenase, partial [Candidatus Marinimicrobia bacterium]|nr:iron-containing alcohol dehydrogenase [Candidatus Neomarinimicrobiota bacterium]
MKNIKGETNVKSLRFGSGSIKGIGKEIGKFIVVTMEVPWKLVKNDIGRQPEEVIFITTVDQDELNKLLAAMPQIDSVIGIGGGMAIDAAKYFSWKRNIRLISIPTIVSVDAFLTPAAGVRSENKVIYIGNSSPDPLIIDYDVIRTAPKTLNVAGVGDLLSIHTASFDWCHAENNKKSEFPYSKENVIGGEKIIDNLYNNIDDIK